MWPVMHHVFGGTFVIAGMVLFPLPIPLGLPLIVIGLALLAPYFPPFQRLIRTLRRKSPGLNRTLSRIYRRMPPIVRKTIDVTDPASGG